jgi:hypothetical protein
MEAALQLVDKLITENAMLIEKVIKGVSLVFFVCYSSENIGCGLHA